MTLSVTNVVAQNEIIYVDDTKPPIPRHLISKYLENGEVSFFKKKNLIGYSDFIFSAQTTQIKKVWKKSDNGVVYVESSPLEQQVAWWMILAVIGIFSMTIAQISKNGDIAVIIASFVILASCFVVIVALGFTFPVAAFASCSAIFAAFCFIDNINRNNNNKIAYIVYCICMMVYVVAMYFAI